MSDETESQIANTNDDNTTISIGIANNSSNRKSYPREHKLRAIDWYYANGKSKHKTERKFGITRRMIADWLAKEDQIRNLKKGQRSLRFRKAFYTDMENRLYDENKEKRKSRLKVLGFWFKLRGKVKPA